MPAVSATPPDAPPPQRSILPWAVGTAAVLALVIAVAVQQSDSTVPAAGPDIPLDGSGRMAPSSANGIVRAPDISSMSPRERADRLYDRVMRLAAEGKPDSARFFANMAAQAYELLGPLDNDLRYDYGRMAELSGDLNLAQQQADQILASNPDHLLGLILRARVAELRNNTAERASFNARLRNAYDVEMAKSVEEYERHKGDIDAAMAEARRGR